MSSALAVAQQALLAPAGLDLQSLNAVFSEAHQHRIGFADLYFQFARSETWSLDEGIVKSGSYMIDRGVGVRVVSGEKTGFAYSDEISMAALTESVRAARGIAASGQSGRMNATPTATVSAMYADVDPVSRLPDEQKVALLNRVEQMARKRDPRVVQVMGRLSGDYEVVLIARSDGHVGADVRPLVNMGLTVIAEHNGRREQGHAGGGGRFGYDWFTDARLEAIVDDAVRQALVNLESRPAPAGTMTVVLGNGWPGVMLHEAVGHGLEGDFNRKGSSAFSGRVGERVAAPGVTVVDDGTMPERRGSLTIDDEGNPTQRNVLIEDGILRGYLQDVMNAQLMRATPTGNGRRESYSAIPMPRMTNTYMLAGDKDPNEIIASVERGVYAVNFGGGEVDITSGKFVFSASEAYFVENGKIQYPVKGATIIGNGPDALTRVSMIGNDLKLDSGIGVCGKEGQSVPVGVGQPTLRIEGLTVGGTA